MSRELGPSGKAALTFVRPLLRAIFHNLDPESECDNTILKVILLMEKVLIDEGVIEQNTVYFIARKQQEDAN